MDFSFFCLFVFSKGSRGGGCVGRVGFFLQITTKKKENGERGGHETKKARDSRAERRDGRSGEGRMLFM